jgi:hypothetical protein
MSTDERSGGDLYRAFHPMAWLRRRLKEVEMATLVRRTTLLLVMALAIVPLSGTVASSAVTSTRSTMWS